MTFQKQYFTLVLLFFSLSTFSQNSYDQDFELGMPNDILLLNVDGLTPNLADDIAFKDLAWQVTFSDLFNSNAAMSISWYENNEGPADDWMVLPRMRLTNSTKMGWEAISTTFGDFPDSYEVLFSEETPTLENVKNIAPQLLLSVENEQFETYSEHTLLLPELEDKTGHIIFRNITQSGDALQIDNISITGIELLTNIQQVKPATFDLQLFPNPSNAKSTLKYTLSTPSTVTISLQNTAGQTVQIYSQSKKEIGTYELPLEVNDLPKGIYSLQLQTEKEYAVTKWVVK